MRKKGEGDAVQIMLLPIQIDQFRELKFTLPSRSGNNLEAQNYSFCFKHPSKEARYQFESQMAQRSKFEDLYGGKSSVFGSVS